MPLTDALLLDPYPFDIWIAWRTDAVGGSGTLNDPYDGSTQAKFDSVMSTKVGPNTRVHLGPGTFLTRGYSDEVSSGWQIQAGMKIIGSGMEVTMLRLVDAQTGGTAARVGFTVLPGRVGSWGGRRHRRPRRFAPLPRQPQGVGVRWSLSARAPVFTSTGRRRLSCTVWPA